MIGLNAFVLSAGAAATAFLLQPGDQIDGERKPSSTESDVRFRCGETETYLRYVEQHRELEDVAENLDRAFHVELLRFRVSGRRISESGMEALEARFRSFAWIETVDLRCNHENVTLLLKVMPQSVWVEAFRNAGPRSSPETVSIAVDISPNGDVSIE